MQKQTALTIKEQRALFLQEAEDEKNRLAALKIWGDTLASALELINDARNGKSISRS